MAVFFNPLFVVMLLVLSFIYWRFIKSEQHQLYFLSGFSLMMLFFIQPYFVPVLLGICYVIWLIKEQQSSGRMQITNVIILTVLLALVILAIGKYGKVLISSMYGGVSWVDNLIIPLGISYLVMRIVQFIFDCVRGLIVQPSFIKFLTFVVFLPTFPAGPVETFNGFFEKRLIRTPNQEFFAWSLQRIIYGYFKKIAVVDFFYPEAFGHILQKVAKSNVDQLGTFDPFFFAVVIFTKAYFDLSAYTDLAIGFSGLFGVRVMENFDRPFVKKNLSEFWRGWHISLSSWCRNNVFFPIYGMTRNSWIAMYCSMIVMGLWHYVDLSWLAWGVHHATGLVFLIFWGEYIRKNKWAKRILNTSYFNRISYVLTFCYVAVGYAFVGTNDFHKGFELYVSCVKFPVMYLLNGLGL